MTTTDEPVETDAAEGPADRTTTSGLGGWTEEALLAVEMVALAAFAFSRPILDSFGRSPETFVARNADTTTIVLFALIVSFGPALLVSALGVASRPLGPAGRRRAHVVLVALVGGVAVWRLGQDVTGWPGDATKLVLAGLLAVPLVGAIRAKLPAVRTFLRYAGAASLLFLAQFLFTSPASSLVLSDGPRLDDDVASSVAAQLGDDPPNVVFVVFDALPVESLLDGTGHIDAEHFPNFARLADTSTWYRDNTTNAIYTGFSVPSILTGRLPATRSEDSSYRPDPENIFTLLGGSYDVRAAEPITSLCPDDVCRDPSTPGVRPLLDDAWHLWWDGTAQAGDTGGSDVPGALDAGRYERAEQWIEQLGTGRGDRPELFFQHVMVPHGPFMFANDGSRYDTVSDLPTGLFGPSWTPVGAAVGHQRHLLQVQAGDRLLGQILDRLEHDDALDDTLVVVTADHGESFQPDEPDRGLSEANADQIAWAPLIIKAPGQDDGQIDDTNVQAIDIVPTVADLLGVDIPWDVDGIPVAQAATERDDTKPLADYNRGHLSDAGELPLVELDGPTHFAEVLAADAVEFDGPDGVWKRTEHGDLVGQHVESLDVAGADLDDGAIDVEQLSDLEDGGSVRPMIEVVGHTRLPDGTTVAYALDGVVGAVTVVGPGTRGEDRMAHALLPPAMLADGPSDLAAYAVTGAVGAEVLTPLDVGAASGR